MESLDHPETMPELRMDAEKFSEVQLRASHQVSRVRLKEITRKLKTFSPDDIDLVLTLVNAIDARNKKT